MVAKILHRINRKRLKIRQQLLFNGDDGLFRKVLTETKLYGEYGCGLSTQWVSANTNCFIFSVDTSLSWLERAHKSISNDKQDRALLHHVNLGKVVEWGYPEDYRHAHKFHEYTDWIWQQEKKPDTVLIDGRFRVCCFLTSLKYAEEGTRLLFDDYIDRPYYHMVEKYVSRAEVCGRQCLFVVPGKDQIDLDALEKDIANFRYVMD